MKGPAEKELAALLVLSGPRLQQQWRVVFGDEPPRSFTNDLLLRGLAHRLQERHLGSLSKATLRELEHGATPPERSKPSKLKSGSRLIRRWRGQIYVVDVEGSAFVFEGKQYGSLSEIAGIITGTRWSGPRFFGLRKQS